MIPYSKAPVRTLAIAGTRIASFASDGSLNADARTIESFGEEWNRFSAFSDAELKKAGDQYFDIVTPDMLPAHSVALDIGCGMGRWSKYISPRVAFVEAIDPGPAVLAAVPFLHPCRNVRVTQAGYGDIPFENESFDFVFSLGVVHHVPDTSGAIKEAASKVKRGGWLLLYIYYSLDNRGGWYRWLFSLSDVARRMISRLPRGLKVVVCDLIAIVVYLPFVLLARVITWFGGHARKGLPLSYYADKPFKVIRNDALDRFGTPLEKRFSREDIARMLTAAGLSDVVFSDSAPYWHVVARK